MSAQFQPFTPIFTPLSSTNSAIGSCNICFNSYDLSDHFPLIVCPNNHTICKFCVNSIRNALFCPFCRSRIERFKILKNKEAMSYIQSKQIRQRLNKRDIAVNNEILNTQFEENHKEDSYIDPIQIFGEEHLEPIDGHPHHSDYQDNLLTVIIFLQLILLQLPVGVYSLYVAFAGQKDSCLKMDYLGNGITLSQIFISIGYAEFSIGFMLMFILIEHYLIFREHEGIYLFIAILTFISVVKAMVSIIIFCRYIFSDFYVLCHGYYMHGVINLVCDNLSLFVGIFLFTKLIQKMCPQANYYN